MLRIGVRIEKSHAGLIRERRPVRFSSGKVGYAYRWIKPDSTRGSASEDSRDQLNLFGRQEESGVMQRPLKFGLVGQEPVVEFEHDGVKYKALGRRIPNIGGDERQVILYRKTSARDVPAGVFMVPDNEKPNPQWVLQQFLGKVTPDVKKDKELPKTLPSSVGDAFNRLSLENRNLIRTLVSYAYSDGLETAERMARYNRRDKVDRKLAELFRHASEPDSTLNTVFFGEGEPRDENGAEVFQIPEKVLAMAVRLKWDERGGETEDIYLDRVDRMIRKRVLGES